MKVFPTSNTIATITALLVLMLAAICNATTYYFPIENHCWRIRLTPNARLVGWKNDPNCDYFPYGNLPPGGRGGGERIAEMDFQVGNVYYYKNGKDFPNKAWNSGTVTVVPDPQYTVPTLVTYTADYATKEFSVTIGVPPENSTVITGVKLACGSTVNACNKAPRYVSPLEKHPVRCCSDVGGSPFVQRFPGRCPDVWAMPWNLDHSNDALQLECANEYGQKTFYEANYICDDVDARLCTADELERDCVTGMGCNFNSKLIWTSETSP